MLKLIIALCLFLSSCSHPPKAKLNSKSVSEPVILQINETKKVEEAYPLTPEKRQNQTDYNPVMPIGSGSSADIALLGALLGIFAITKSNEPRKDLRGTCMYGEPEVMISATPCIHVKVKLLTQDNRIASEMTTNEMGDFRFFVPAHKTYSLQVIDRKGRNALLQKQVGRSDYVTIFIKP